MAYWFGAFCGLVLGLLVGRLSGIPGLGVLVGLTSGVWVVAALKRRGV